MPSQSVPTQDIGRFDSVCDHDSPAVFSGSSHDTDEQAERLAQWNQSYVQLSPGKFEGKLLETRFGGMQFLRETTNQKIHETGSSWPGSRTFCVPVAMEGDAWFRGMRWTADSCATMGGDVELDLRTGQALDVIAVSLETPRLIEQANQRGVSSTQLARWLSGSCIAQLPPTGVVEMRRMLLEIAALLESQSMLLRHAAVRDSIENAMYDTLSSLIVDAMDLRAPAVMYLPKRQLVMRAIDFIRSHPDRVVTVADLCTLLRVSRRTLQDYFEAVLHFSPLQYLRAYRLNRVRAALRNDETLLVSDAAARFGFWHLSQFAHDYKLLFGESPSQTFHGRVSGMPLKR